MATDQNDFLKTTIAALQKQHGSDAIGLGVQGLSAISRIPTGFSELDTVLVGGTPCGCMTEILSIPTAGGTTVTLQTVTQAQKQGVVAYLDLEQGFDGACAIHAGVSLEHLVLIRPEARHQALQILKDLVMGGGITLLVFDCPFRLLIEQQTAKALSTTLGQVLAPLSKTDTALLFLTRLPPNSSPTLFDYPTALRHYAAVRLLVHLEQWLEGKYQVQGYEAQVQLLKNKLGAFPQQTTVAITIDGDF